MQGNARASQITDHNECSQFFLLHCERIALPHLALRGLPVLRQTVGQSLRAQLFNHPRAVIQSA